MTEPKTTAEQVQKHDEAMKTYTITHGQLFRETHERQAESEHQLRQTLEREHPEWFPVQIEVKDVAVQP